MAKKRIEPDPEQVARYAEAKQLLQERIDHNERLIQEAKAREERRRRRLQRLTFGLLPR